MAGTDLKTATRRARVVVERLSPTQKIAIGAGVVTLVVGGLLVTRSGGSSAMAPLYTDLASADASAVVDELAAQGVAYELTDAGRTVLVPQDQVYDLRIAMSADGLPSSTEGYSLLDKQGITTSEFRQRVDYQRALEGELARTLLAMEGITAATVHLALPEDTVFVDEPGQPTASVLVSTRDTAGLGDDQVDAIVHLVASSIEGMTPENVTVVGADGQVLSAPGRVGGGGGATARTKAEAAFEDDLAASLTAMLARVTGPSHVAVTVSADLDLSQRQSTSEDFDPDTEGTEVPQVVNERVTTEAYGEGATDGGTTGVLGPDGATIAPQVTADSVPGGAYERTDADRTYALDRVVEQVTEAPGRIERLNVAVLLDDATVSADQAESIQAMVAAAAGIDTTRGDSLVVTSLPFETSTTDELAAAQAEAAAAQKSTEQMALYRTLGIVALGLIALIFAFISTRRARRVTLTPIDIGEITASPAAAAATVAIPAPPPIAIPQPTDRTAAAMAAVTEMAERRPEDVAGILRTWLAETKDGR